MTYLEMVVLTATTAATTPGHCYNCRLPTEVWNGSEN